MFPKIKRYQAAIAIFLVVFIPFAMWAFSRTGRYALDVQPYVIIAFFVGLFVLGKFYLADIDDGPKEVPATDETINFEYYVPPMPVWETNPFKSHGSADWDNPKDFRFRPDSRRNVKDKAKGSIYIGGGLSQHYLHSLTHAVTIAGSGQGKGASVILPNLLSKPTCSWLILDPKGENAKITARFHKEQGQKVVILDPWNEQQRLGATHGIVRMGFNPLDFVKGNPEEMIESCAVIASMLVPDQKTADPFWNNRARALIKTYLIFLITSLPETEHTLGTLYTWLRLPLPGRDKLWNDIEKCDHLNGIIKSSIGEFTAFGRDSKTLDSIIATAQDCTTFLESQPLRQSLERRHFNPYDLPSGKMTVYVCLPERFLITHSRWLRLVVGVCLKACNYKPNNRVNFLLDEFAILGKMQDVENAFAFARGQNISMWIFVQSLTQLKDIYGEQGASTFLANARLRQFFGILDYPTQKFLSDYLGDTTLKVKTQNSTESSSNSKTTSKGTTEGSSSGGSTAGPHGSSSWGSSSGTSESESAGYTHSSSQTESEQYITRKLLTPEEVGKTKEIITLLDSQKFKINRVPYWKDATDWPLNELPYMPYNKDDWQNFWHEVCKNKGKNIAINFAQMGRADMPKMRPGQSI